MRYKTTDRVKLRKTPNLKGEEIEVLAIGTIVDSDEYTWKEVTLKDGRKGYCAAEYLEKDTLLPLSKWFAPIDKNFFVVGQPFLNPDAETYPKCKHHPGVDYPLKGARDIKIYFCADGEVIESGVHSQFGNYFFYYVPEVDRTFAYFHLREIPPKKGKYKAGVQAGFVGTTGKSTGPHLHLECIKGKKTSAERISLYTSKEALMAVAEDADAFIRARL